MHDCILLAAGGSSRMASASPKPLLPLWGSTLAEIAARAALDAGCRLILVVGNRAEETAAAFARAAYAAPRAEGWLIIAHNARWAEGMVSSIQAALPLVRTEAFFVAHADMPFVEAGHYRALAGAREAALREGRPDSAFLASWEGRAGHPALLPSAWIPGILGLGPGERLRPFIEARSPSLVETGPGATFDIDRPEDYAAALARDVL